MAQLLPRNWLMPAIGVFAMLSVVAGLFFITRPVGQSGASMIGGHFALTDQNGKIVDSASLKGKPFIVFFGFTHCPDICPTTLFQLSEAMRALGPGSDLKAFFISVDPERDTPALMKDYLASFDPRISGLSGDRAAVDEAIRAYRVYARKVPTTGTDYTMDHTALVYLMDARGQFVSSLNLDRPAAEVAGELKKML